MWESGQSPETCRLWGWMHSTCGFPTVLSQLPCRLCPREIRLECSSGAAPEASQQGSKGASRDSYTARLWPSHILPHCTPSVSGCRINDWVWAQSKDEALSALPQWWGSHRTSPHQLAKQLPSVLPTVSLGHAHVSFQLQCKVRV